MRIVLVTGKFLPYSTGGVEVLAQGLAHSYQTAGHQVKILSTVDYESFETAYVDELYANIFVRRIPVNTSKRSLATRAYDPQLLPMLRQTFAEWQPDIVHILTTEGFSGVVIAAAREYASRVFYTATGYGLFCTQIELIKPNGDICNGHASFAKCYDCCRPKNWRSLPFYGLTAWMPQSQFGKFTSGVERFLRRKEPIAAFEIGRHLHERSSRMSQLTRMLDHIIAPSHWVKQTLVWNGISADHVSVVQHGVAPDVVGNGQKTESQQIRFGYLGRIVKIKGVDLLIRAFLELPKENQVVLKIFGPGSSHEQGYLDFCHHLGHSDPRITFHGPVSREELALTLSEIDVLVAPSAWHEVLGIVVQEGLANQTPVIGAKIGGIQDLINHEENGLLFSMDDREDLLRCLQKCCDRDFLARLRSNSKPVPTVVEEARQLLTLYHNERL